MVNDPQSTQPPSWIPLRAVVTPILKSNIDYLSAFDPDLFEQIKSNRGNEELMIVEEQGLIRCRTCTEPIQWIFGEQSPRHDGMRLREKAQSIPRDASLLILRGCAAGYAVKMLAETFLAHPRHRLLVLESSAARIRLGMLHVDLRSAWQTGRFHWALGDLESDMIFTAIDYFNLWGHEKVFLFDCNMSYHESMGSSFETEYRARSTAMERQKHQSLIALRDVRTKAFETSLKSDASIRRVLLFDCWKNCPQGLHVQSIDRALHERGVETQVIQLDGVKIDLMETEYRRLNERKVLQTMQQFQPDLVLSYAYHAPQILGRELFEAAHVPWVQVASNFAYYDTTYYAGEHTALAERFLVSDYQKRGAPHPFFVPLMANYVAQKPTPTCRKYPIVFVGNPFTLSPAEMEAFRRRYQGRGQLGDAIRAAIRELGDFDRGLDLFHYLQENPLPQLENDREYYDIFRHLLCVTTEMRRRSLLETIAGEGLALFGNWGNAVNRSSLQGCFQRYLPMNEEPALFSEGHIFLNIHTVANVTGPNMRFFNVAGMGGLLLSDGNFSDYLQPDEEMIRYTNVRELLEKVRYYLAHPEQGDAIRQRGFDRIRSQWTYSHWVDRVFEEIGVKMDTRGG